MSSPAQGVKNSLCRLLCGKTEKNGKRQIAKSKLQMVFRAICHLPFAICHLKLSGPGLQLSPQTQVAYQPVQVIGMDAKTSGGLDETPNVGGKFPERVWARNHMIDRLIVRFKSLWSHVLLPLQCSAFFLSIRFTPAGTLLGPPLIQTE